MGVERYNKLLIRTPEGFSFSMLLAGPITRFLAWLIDMVIVMTTIALFLYLSSKFWFGNTDTGEAMLILLFFTIWFGYGIVLEWYCQGKTVGKRIFNLRVVDEHGLHLTFGQIAIRNLMRGVDCLPMLYLIGGIACILSKRSQRLGDVAAGTVVVRTVDTAMGRLADTASGGDKFNSFTHYPHIEARLRQRISPAEARIALQTLLRRDSLDPDSRIELFSELAEHFKTMLDFPAQATDGLSDEQYVRNVVDTLFRSQLKP